MKRRLGLLALLGAAAMITTGGTAGAATVENGTFETGDLRGWKKDFFAEGFWFAHEGEFSGPLTRGPKPLVLVPDPPQGDWAAISHQGSPSAMFFSQKVKLKDNRRHKLRFQLAYRNQSGAPSRGGKFQPGFHTPNHFRFGKSARPNQQFRMDVMKPGADIKSLRSDDILEEVYITERRDPRRRGYRPVSANLTDLAGRTVRLRFAVVVTEAPLNVGIDAVKVRTKRLG